MIVLPFSVGECDRMLAARAGRKIDAFFPDEGPLRRTLYPKHLAFMAAGAKYRERCFLAGNQVGKTEVGAYEMACHLTGVYPTWWEGRRFTQPVQAWAAGDTSRTVRGILQVKLLGPIDAVGTGMIPKDAIHHIARSSVPEAFDTVWIKHVSGGNSALEFKSYEQGRKAFQGTVKHVIWLDEEPDEAIYTECLMRTITSDGIVYLTFTPLQGVTNLVLSFLQQEQAA